MKFDGIIMLAAGVVLAAAIWQYLTEKAIEMEHQEEPWSLKQLEDMLRQAIRDSEPQARIDELKARLEAARARAGIPEGGANE